MNFEVSMVLKTPTTDQKPCSSERSVENRFSRHKELFGLKNYTKVRKPELRLYNKHTVTCKERIMGK